MGFDPNAFDPEAFDPDAFDGIGEGASGGEGISSSLYALTVYADTGLDVYVMFNDSEHTAVNLTEGTENGVGEYTTTNAAINSAGLGNGKFSWRALIGTAASKSPNDTLLAAGDFEFYDGQEATISRFLEDGPYSLTLNRALEVLLDALVGASIGAGTGTEVISKYDRSGVSFVVTTDKYHNRRSSTIQN